MSRLGILLSLLLLLPANALAQAPDPAKLSLDRVFASDDFRGDRVPAMKWLEDGTYLTMESPGDNKHGNDLVRHDAAGKKEVFVAADKLVPPGSKDPLAIEGYELSKDLDLVLIFTNSAKVWRMRTRGDYWTFRRSTGKLAKLGGDAKPSTLMFAKIAPDGTRVGYVMANNLYVEPASGGPATKLTMDGTEELINGTFDWVYEEEFFCRDGWRWSPDSTKIAYWQLDTHGVKTFTLVDNTSASYPTLKTFAYPKAGERNSACRIGVVPATGGTTQWLAIPGDTRTNYYLPRLAWLENPMELVIQRLNRRQNANDVIRADPETGKVRIVHTDRDGAWVDVHDDACKWIDNGAAFTWISEQDGWRHLYVVGRDGNNVRKVTTGDFDVVRVLRIDEKASQAYFLASPENPTQHYLYRVSLTGTSAAERLTPTDQVGWHDYNVSPDGATAVHTFSTFGNPPRTELIQLPSHQVIRVLATNDKLREVVGKLAHEPVEFFRVDIGIDVKLDGWMIKPPGFDPAKKYPLFFHVYGEPAGQTVVDRWGGADYLWYLMLAQKGYVVACIDNRGTPCPRGRDWRRSVYRRIGTLASEDQATATRALLKERSYLDATRVGVWGWSGGGTMTLNLLFRHPDVYQVGMAIASVPDMRLYDSIYQERYMGLPQENLDDYKNGSPITHAAGLKGKLLVIHGSGDDNCHFQGMEKLANALIELNKPFTMMEYPNRSHSIDEGKNTRRHLFALLTQYLYDNLPVEPKR